MVSFATTRKYSLLRISQMWSPRSTAPSSSGRRTRTTSNSNSSRSLSSAPNSWEPRSNERRTSSKKWRM
jgi:hypothetical protein